MTLVFLLLHIVTAVVDPFTHLGLVAAVVPFGSYYRTLWLGLGTIAFELLIAIVATSLLRHHIGARVWRAIHWLAYRAGRWPSSTDRYRHGQHRGVDVAIDIVCVAAVAGALLWRLSRRRPTRSRANAVWPRSVRRSGRDDEHRVAVGAVPGAGMEGFAAHQQRLGPLPPGRSSSTPSSEATCAARVEPDSRLRPSGGRWRHSGPGHRSCSPTAARVSR